ncbi:MAG TPA: TIGR02444 family protein [Xanthobacteraceae bacterium]
MPAVPPSSSPSPFWRFSLQFYRLPGVAEACIRLQEEAGADVNLLLFLLWNAARQRALTVAQVTELEQRIAAWRDRAVIPLRAIRRALKSPQDLVEGGAAEAFRTRIKAVELEAERLQQEAMYDLVRVSLLGETAPSAAEAARANVAAYARICDGDFAAPAVDTLLAALASAKVDTQ